ncbi:MAG: thioredoxin-dependent thiol peroxidase [bacterium]|nr:thioredoxin-dependent thiol peroxidase [bacterium]
MSITVGSKAPAFSLPDQNGDKHSLASYKGKYVLLYFYPKDMTPGCTIEARVMSKNIKEFAKYNAVVLGVSVDSCASHKKFEGKEKLTFTLLSDEDKVVVDKYDVWREKSMFGKKYMGAVRESFLIDPTGGIIKHYTNVNPVTHTKEVLGDLKGFQK